MKKFYMWWISVLLIGTGVFWANHYGFVHTILTTDTTHITTIISILFVTSNITLGYYSYKVNDATYSRERLVNILDMNWFLAEIMMALGMLGTVIGLIHMLTSISTSGVDAAQIQDSLGSMWQSLGLALYTNAVGLVASIVLKLQVYFLSYGEPHEAQPQAV